MIWKLFYWIWNVEQKVELMFAQYGIIFHHEANKIVHSNSQNYTNRWIRNSSWSIKQNKMIMKWNRSGFSEQFWLELTKLVRRTVRLILQKIVNWFKGWRAIVNSRKNQDENSTVNIYSLWTSYFSFFSLKIEVSCRSGLFRKMLRCQNLKSLVHRE